MAYCHKLTESEQQELLRIARAALATGLGMGSGPESAPTQQALVDGAGAFVTLRGRDGDLRGCIGTQDESRPVYRTIEEMAVAAATRDHRFPHVMGDELADLVIEISVLGDHERIKAATDIEIGLHGVTIRFGGSRGLLLPQVAPAQGWNAETLLERVCSKAGLPSDSWSQDDALVERFTAQVFGEPSGADIP